MVMHAPSGSTTEDLVEVAVQVGMPTERMWDLVIMDNEFDLHDRNDLAWALNFIGYYDEKADHLVAAGITFT